MADNIKNFDILFNTLVEDRIDYILYLISTINNLFIDTGFTPLTDREKLIVALLSKYIPLKKDNNG